MNPEGRVPKEFMAIVTFVVISVVFIVVPPLNATPVKIIVGFPLVLFLPGYSLICALFSKKNEMDGIERIALSIGLSIAVVVIIGLVLNYTSWGIRSSPILLAISSFTLIFTAVTAARRQTTVTEYKSIPIDRSTFNFLLLILLYGFLSHLYFPLRYSGLIADGDMGIITKTVQAVQAQARISTTYPYSSGFGLQLVITFLSNITGLSTQQLLILPIGFLYVIIAYPLFLELIRNNKAALLATFLLCLQPVLLHVTNRGSHERFTFFLALMVLFILMRLISLKQNNKKFVLYLTLFYLAIFSLIAFNSWFSAFIIINIVFISLIGFLFSRAFNIDSLPYRKSLYVIISCIPLYYCISFYIHPPSQVTWNLLNIWRKNPIMLGITTSVIAILALIRLMLRPPIMSALKNHAIGFSQKIHTSKTYRKSMHLIIGFVLLTYIIGIYILAVPSRNFLSFPPSVWLFLTLFNWIIFPFSVITVFTIIWDFIRRRSISFDSRPILFLFYVSFSLSLLITIFLDRVIGTGIGDNLELRIFPYFMFFAVALASMTILKWRHQLHAKRWQSTGKILFIILIIILSVNSLLKSTNDPIVSNNWLFFSAGEKIGMHWIESNLEGVAIWAGLDHRIAAAFSHNSSFDSFKKIGFSSPEKAKYYFVSDTIKERGRRADYSLPSVKGCNRIYENGKVKLYYRRVKNLLH